MMMVLSMYIIGDSAADRDTLRARRDRQEPAFRHHPGDDLGELHASFAFEYSCRLVKRDVPVQSRRVQQGAAIVQAAVAVTPTVSIRQDCARALRQRRIAIIQYGDVLPGAWIPPPGRAGHAHQIAPRTMRPQTAMIA